MPENAVTMSDARMKLELNNLKAALAAKERQLADAAEANLKLSVFVRVLANRPCMRKAGGIAAETCRNAWEGRIPDPKVDKAPYCTHCAAALLLADILGEEA